MIKCAEIMQSKQIR